MPACGAGCLAAVFVRKALEEVGIGAEGRVLVSLIAGALVYGGCMMLFGRSVVREVVDVVRTLGPAMRPKA